MEIQQKHKHKHKLKTSISKIILSEEGCRKIYLKIGDLKEQDSVHFLY